MHLLNDLVRSSALVRSLRRALGLVVFLSALSSPGWTLCAALLTPEKVNLGDVNQYELKEGTFVIENASPRKIIITAWETTCSCTITDLPSNLDLSARERRNVKVKVGFAGGLGTYEARVVMKWKFADDDKINDATVPVMGRVVSLATAAIGRIDFGEVQYAQPPKEMSFVLNRGNSAETWDEIGVEADLPGIVARVAPLDKDRYTVRVAFSPEGLPLQQLKAMLTVHFARQGVRLGGEMRMPVLARVSGPLSASRQSVYFGALSRDVKAKREIEINSTGPDLREAEVSTNDVRLTSRVLSRTRNQLRVELGVDGAQWANGDTIGGVLSVASKDPLLRLNIPTMGLARDAAAPAEDSSGTRSLKPER